MNLTVINRLSRPKQGVYYIPMSSRYTIEHTRQRSSAPPDKNTINSKEQDGRNSTKQNFDQQRLIDISNRLSREQPRRGESAKPVSKICVNNNINSKTIPNKELDQLNKRMSRPLNRQSQTPPPVGEKPSPPKKLSEMENSINRLSTPKRIKERTIDRFVLIERGRNNKKKTPLTNTEITGLCQRLADPKYARVRTPDTRRLLDRTFSPVNTYAWQGIAHNNIDWKVYSPHSVLVQC